MDSEQYTVEPSYVFKRMNECIEEGRAAAEMGKPMDVCTETIFKRHWQSGWLAWHEAHFKLNSPHKAD